MNIAQFNQLLQKYSDNLIRLKTLRSQINCYSTEEIFLYMANIDISANGFLRKQNMINAWCKNEPTIGQDIKLAFLSKIFAPEKISYSIISKFLLGSSQTKSGNEKKTPLQSLVCSIFSLELNNSLAETEVTKNINFFIPMQYSRPEKQEINQYASNQQIDISVDEISLALNLIDSNINEQSKAELNFEQTLCDPSINNIDKLMKRLQNRVNSFGKEWLLTREQQGYQ